MALEEEIVAARKEIVSDGYDMSIGELINLYKSNEIQIAPEFQRLFRWGPSRKTRFVESILLGLPLPPIFVYQNKDGVWELIDGLQRLSTVLEFVGVLKDADTQQALPATVLEGTRFLPSLSGKIWEKAKAEGGEADAEDDDPNALSVAQQLQIKRARIRVEILKQESDPQAKYELFQRLNTGGVALSEQEVRNCVSVMLDRPFHVWLVERAEYPGFALTTNQTESAIEKQTHVELALRFFAFRHIPYTSGLDVHEYLDDALVKLITKNDFDRAAETAIFNRTFDALSNALGDAAFKRWNGQSFSGMFLQSLFEVVATGVAQNIDAIDALGDQRNAWLSEKCKQLWDNQTFTQNSGAGVRGTTRLSKLIPLAKEYFTP